AQPAQAQGSTPTHTPPASPGRGPVVPEPVTLPSLAALRALSPRDGSSGSGSGSGSAGRAVRGALALSVLSLTLVLLQDWSRAKPSGGSNKVGPSTSSGSGFG